MDFRTQIEHDCCAATVVMVILGGAEVDLDERLELNEGKLWLYFCCSLKYIWYCMERRLHNLRLSKLPHLFFQLLGWEKKERRVTFGQKSGSNKNLKSTLYNIFVPVSIFAKARFVMWKKPSFMRRNIWYIPVKKQKYWKTWPGITPRELIN